MSSGKSKQKTDNSLDPWSQQQFTQQQSHIRNLLGGSSAQPSPSYYVGGAGGGSTGFDYSAFRGVPGMSGATYQPANLGISTGQPAPANQGGYQGDFGATELSDYEQQAGDLINQYIGSYEGGLDDARTALNELDFTPRTFADFDADTYVNPYADDIIAQTTGDIQEAADRTRNGIKSENLAQGAYGGSRHGVREALVDESMLDSIADMSAQTRFNVWDRGADRFYQDVNNDFQADAFGLQRAGMLSDFVGMERGFQDQDIDRLLGLGGRDRNVRDLAAAREYDNYWRRIQAEMGLLNSIPIIQDGSSTSSYRPGALDYVNSGANLISGFMGG